MERYEGRNLKNNKRTEGYRRKRKKRRARAVFLTGISILVLTLLTGCVILMLHNRKLQSQVSEAMAYIDDINSVVVYTEEEVKQMTAEAAAEASREAAWNAEKAKEEEILGGIQAMMEEGESTAAMLRTFYPEDVVVASDGRYYFFPISDTLKQHAYQKEGFAVNEEKELEYRENDEVISRKGIDVSKYQSDINWRKVAGDGVEYAFIRLGIRGATEGKLVLDDKYEENMEGAIENGIETGVYFFTQALNEKEAIEEAEFVLENMQDYEVTYPVVLDVEEITTKNARTREMTKEERTKACIAFCERIRQAGYTPMIYGNLKTFMLMLDMEQLEEYEKWFAYYDTELYFPYEFSIWQYTAKGSIAGIKGDVDLNISMRDWAGEM